MTTPRYTFFSRLMFFLNIVAAFFLLLSYAASYIPPDGNLWWLQLIGLAYGILLSVNLAFIIFWLFFGRKKSLLSFFVIVIGFGKIFNIVEPRFQTPPFADSESISVRKQSPPGA